MTEKSTIPRLFPDTFLIGQVELTGQYTGPIVRGRLFINDQHVSWGGTFNNGFFTYYVGPDRIKRHDKVELVGYDSDNNELTRAVVTIKVETENALFKKNESLIRIQAERVDPISTKVVFFSHDRGTAKMYFKLEKDGAPQPLSNGTVVPICLEGGSETSEMGRFRHVYHAVIEDAAEGLVSIILKNNILGHQGRADGSIYIKPPNDQQLDTAGRFIFHIERSPIDDMTESVSQFYYEGFHEIYEKLANAKQQVEDDLTEMSKSVKAMLDEIEAEVDRYKKDAEAKFIAINNSLTSLAATITQLENRLTTVKNEINALLSDISVATRNYLFDTHIERTGRSEFLNDPSWDLAPLIDEYGLDREYTISFDLKSAVAGQIRVYSQNGSTFRYNIGTHIFNATTEYQRYSLTFKPEKSAAFETETRSLLAFFGTYGTGRIPTVRNVFFGLGNITGDWMPNLDELAKQESLEEMNQKVKMLEQNTIRLTNQFPDPNFQKREPRPFNEGNFAMTYDANGVVLNNTTVTKGRVYWATPPLSLAIGRSYNVAMFVNTDQASVRKQIEVGAVNGENIKFELQNTSPVWIQGTIKLTTFAAFSIWLDPATVLRIRELHIYEANTDITTARIERLEKDNSLPAISPTFDRRFISYSADNGIWHCQVERTGNIVALSGAIANTEAIATTGTEKILMARLPVGYRPKKTVNRVMAGSGTAIFNMEIDPTGEIYMARYRGATTSFTYAAVQFVGAWLNVGTTFLGEDI